MKIKYKPFFSRNAALAMAAAIAVGNYALLREMAKVTTDKVGTWGYHAAKLVRWIDAGMEGPLPFRIFVKGNSKLPFWAISSLPVVNCPGAGDCLNFCYSLTGWRYPAAFMRQAMISILLTSEKGRAIIAEAFSKLKKGIVRLYVDGDFKNVSDVIFWMELIASRPDIKVYGYSKSWIELISAGLKKGFQWPVNYLLNLSSGAKHGPEIKAIVSKLPIVRGEFIAIMVDKLHIANRSYQGPHKAGFREYQKNVMENANGQRVFVCKGRCGSCLPNGEHACGSEKFRGVPIAIGVH